MRRGRNRRSGLAQAYGAAEAIASFDRSNLYLASCFFEDSERYEAFCAYYALMRVVDDRIDRLPDRIGLSGPNRRREHEVVSAWEAAVRECFEGRTPSRSGLADCRHTDAPAILEAFGDSLAVFPAPFSLWANFFRSMHWDLDHDRFDTWREFIAYTEGASVAPTTVYLALLASRPGPFMEMPSVPAGFNLLRCGRELGIFAYLGHIVRDIAEDLRAGRRGLLYMSQEDMTLHGVTESDLRHGLERGRASAATRCLVADLLGRARCSLARGRESMIPLRGRLERDCAFILELIVTMYERVIDKVEACGFDPLTDRHRLTGTEKGAILREVANRTGFDLAPFGFGSPSAGILDSAVLRRRRDRRHMVPTKLMNAPWWS